MIPLIQRIVHALLYDEMAARRWLRGGLFGFATGGLAFADQLAAIVSSPGAVKGIKVAAVVSGFVAAMINLGEKNQKAE